jgi:hypothetical protein
MPERERKKIVALPLYQAIDQTERENESNCEQNSGAVIADDPPPDSGLRGGGQVTRAREYGGLSFLAGVSVARKHMVPPGIGTA